MSMRSYPLIGNCYFVIDNEVIAHTVLAKQRHGKEKIPNNIKIMLENNIFNKLARNGELPEEYKDEMYAIELLDCYWVSTFTGETSIVFSEKATYYNNDIDYEDGTILYFIPIKIPNLFKQVYSSPEELLNEYKETFRDLGIILPEDFDWWGHIRNIDGTYYC